MRMRTIKRRMRLAMLPDDLVDILHILMQGISDESTRAGGKANLLWTASVGVVLLQNAERRKIEKN